MDEGKNQKPNKAQPSPAAAAPQQTTFDSSCPLFNQSMGSLNPNIRERILKRLEAFVSYKMASPMQAFGSSDYLFASESPLKGYKHAHLTGDHSLVYTYDGKKNRFYLYGVFTHADLGTAPGASRSNKIQAAMGQKLAGPLGQFSNPA
jgi:hypothetical protein